MMDFLLEAWVSGIIEGKKIQWMMGKREPWQPGEKRESRIVFIGRNLPGRKITEGFENCIAQ